MHFGFLVQVSLKLSFFFFSKLSKNRWDFSVSIWQIWNDFHYAKFWFSMVFLMFFRRDIWFWDCCFKHGIYDSVAPDFLRQEYKRWGKIVVSPCESRKVQISEWCCRRISMRRYNILLQSIFWWIFCMFYHSILFFMQTFAKSDHIKV